MVYLAGVHLFHIENEFPDPTKEAPLLHYLCTAIRCSDTHKARKRHPITLPLLRTIKAELSQSSLPSRDKLMYWAAFVLAFYGFLRASEYTAPTASCFDPRVHLSVKDITVCPESITLHLKRSKTDRFGKVGHTPNWTNWHFYLPRPSHAEVYGHSPVRTSWSPPDHAVRKIPYPPRHVGDHSTPPPVCWVGFRLLQQPQLQNRCCNCCSCCWPTWLLDQERRSTAYQKYIRTSPAIHRGAASHIARMH